MHIADGVLSSPVLLAGAAASTIGVGYGLYRMKPEEVPQTAVLSAAFFVSSLIHVPVPPASAHLMLTGLIGVMLGWSAFPAILLALLLQCLLFMHGGLSALGVNVLCMAVPAVCCHYLFRPMLSLLRGRRLLIIGFLIGAAGIGLSAVMVSLVLYASHQALLPAIAALLAGNIMVALVEGGVTAAAVSFLVRVRPAVFGRVSVPEGIELSDKVSPEIS